MSFFLFSPVFFPSLELICLNDEISNQPKGSYIPSTVNWNFRWGSSNRDIAEDVWGDDEIIYTIGTLEENTTEAKIIVTKFTNGHRASQEWNRTWSNGKGTYGKALWTNKTHIFCVGYDLDNIYLIAWDENGTEVWNSSWCFDGNLGQANSIWGVCDYLYLCGSYLTDMLLIKYHINGTFLWYKTWGGLGFERGLDIWGDNESIFTCGSTSSYGAGLSDGVVVRWNITGDVIWNDTWGTIYHENFTSIYGYEDNIYVCGGEWNVNKGATDVLIKKWFSNGTLGWKRRIGRDLDDFGYSIWANEYYVYVCGFTHNDDLEHPRILFLKYTYSGNRDERRTFGNKATEDIGKALFVLSDTLYICGTYGVDKNQILLNYFSLPTPQPPDFKDITPNPSLNGTFLIEWKSVAGAESYNLYKDIHPIIDISNRTPYQVLSNTNFTEYGLEEGTYFYILTTNFKGVESIMSRPGVVLVDYPDLSERRIDGFKTIQLLVIIGLAIIFLRLSTSRKIIFHQ